MIVINPTKKVNIENILEWCNENMDESEVPTLFKLVTGIARDSSGHVDKLKIKSLFNDDPLLCFYDSKLWRETTGEILKMRYTKNKNLRRRWIIIFVILTYIFVDVYLKRVLGMGRDRVEET